MNHTEDDFLKMQSDRRTAYRPKEFSCRRETGWHFVI